jgi:hypothetical protein
MRDENVKMCKYADERQQNDIDFAIDFKVIESRG